MVLMKRTALALMLILALSISTIAGIAGITIFKVASANMDAAPLTISILSPANNSYFSSVLQNYTYYPPISFQLIYQTNEPLSLVEYSIDGGSNVTVYGNDTTVEEPTDANYHNLTLYAEDNFGNWATPQTVYYLITPIMGPPPPVPEFPKWIVLPLFAVVILLSTIFIRKKITEK